MDTKREPSKLTIDVNSELVAQLSERKVGELVQLSCEMAEAIKQWHGLKYALLVQKLGTYVTESVNKTLMSLIDIVPDEVFVYLTSIVAVNMAMSVLGTLDNANFNLELEDYGRGEQ